MSKNSKKKGNRGELQLVHMLCERFGEGRFKRTPSSGAYTGGLNRESSKNLSEEAKLVLASDIICPLDFRFVIEHKFYNKVEFWELFSEKSKLNEWIEQVEGDAKFVDREPLVIAKYDRHNRIAIINEDSVKGLIDPVFVWLPKKSSSKYAFLWLEDLLKLQDDFWFRKE